MPLSPIACLRRGGDIGRLVVFLFLMVMPMLDDVAAAREIVVTPAAVSQANLLQAAPYNFEFTGEDALRITCANSQSSVVVAVHYRMKRPDMSSHANTAGLTPTSDRVAGSSEIEIGTGYLLNLVVVASSGTPKLGQTYVTVDVIRGRGANAVLLGTIVAGYVTPTRKLAWPGSPLETSTEGDGYVRLITGTAPGAGSNLLETVPTGARWELLSFKAQLVADGAVATRRAGLFFDDGASAYFRSPSPVTQTAGQTADHYFEQGATFATSILTDVAVAYLPNRTTLLAGHRIRTATNGLQAGDVYAAPLFEVREWLEV